MPHVPGRTPQSTGRQHVSSALALLFSLQVPGLGGGSPTPPIVTLQFLASSQLEILCFHGDSDDHCCFPELTHTVLRTCAQLLSFVLCPWVPSWPQCPTLYSEGAQKEGHLSC